MKYDNRVLEADKHLTDMGIVGIDFSITDKFCETYFYKHVYDSTKIAFIPMNEREHDKAISRQVNYVKLTMLKLKYMRNSNRSKGIKEGFVYMISNPSFPGWVKIGSTVDVYERLNTYQTYSPMRDYVIDGYYFSYDRFAEEFMYHKRYESNNEWVVLSDELLKDFSERRVKSRERIV